MPLQVLRTPTRSAMNVPLPERLQQLTSRMLRKKLFIVTMTSEVTPDRGAHLADHFEYMTELLQARRPVRSRTDWARTVRRPATA